MMNNLFLNIIQQAVTTATSPSQYVYIFGTPDLWLFMSCLIFAYIGMVVRVLIDIHGRNPSQAGRPVKFDWKFFFSDNATRLLVNVIIVALAVRFIPDPNFLGKTLTPFSAFMVGFGSDYLVKLLKSKEKAFLGDSTPDTVTSTTTTSEIVTPAVSEVTATTTTSGVATTIEEIKA